MSIVILERDFTLCLRHAEENTVSLFKHGEKLQPTVSSKDPVLPAKSSLLQKQVTSPKVLRKRLNSANCICASQPMKTVLRGHCSVATVVTMFVFDWVVAYISYIKSKFVPCVLKESCLAKST